MCLQADMKAKAFFFISPTDLQYMHTKSANLDFS